MGREKGGIVHPDGRTMVRRAVDLLKEAGCEKVVVALREGQDLSEDVEDVEDVRDAGGGALGGIVAGMKTGVEEDWLVVACDLPRLKVGVLRDLLGFDDDFVVYERNGRLEPLCGFYGKNAFEILTKSMEVGEWGLQKILRANGVKIVELEDFNALENANTPEDWERLSRQD